MGPRINIQEKGQKALSALYGLSGYLAKSPIEQSLLNLVYYRVSQINGFAFCLDIHSKDLRADGETEQRLYVMDAWRETPFYSDRERAALEWTEALTKLKGTIVPDNIYTRVRKILSEVELIDLTIAIITINGWNRINIAFGAPVGTYQVGQFSQ